MERYASLPDGWEVATLGEICSKVTDGSHNPPKKQTTGLPMLSAVNISNNKINFDQFRYISAEDFARENRRTNIQKGDVLVTIVGSIGRAAVVPESCRQFTLQRSVAVLKAVEVNPNFLALQIESAVPQKYLLENAKGTAQKGVYLRTLSMLPLRIPPLKEQRRIVDKIETLFTRLDKGEEALREVQRQLARYRQSVLKAAVTGELTADWRAQNAHKLEHGKDLLARILQTRRETWEGRGKYKEPVVPNASGLWELPEGWVWASVEQVSTAVDYGTSAKCSSDASGIPVLRMGNIVDGSLELENLKYLPESHSEFPKLLLEGGDILFNRTNSAELVGKTAVYHGLPAKCSYASYLIRVRLEGIVPDFLSAFINSVFGRAWVKSVVSQQVGQANVNGSKLKALSIPLPPEDEQREIITQMTDRLTRMGDLTHWCEAEIARSAALRQSILKDAFAGRLVLQDPTDEPASELLARIKAEKADAPKKSRRKATA